MVGSNGERSIVTTSHRESPRKTKADRLPVWRIGVVGGLVGILCCVGPTVLALLGLVTAGTAFAWATNLYDGYAWWFRLGGLAVLAVLVWLSLRRRDQCSVAGMRRWWWRLLGVLGIAVGTYVALYALTTWLGTFA
ncbi:hypothetical protein ATK30_8652 [Amycolatopsis echigonensis]|uniref:Uncharacterized protein n=1 Tax=Amycolatopsis echigonensis TaxID=2576905 RepID=A0A2N3WUV8_9PSEU|nr:hypothetical protein ATK30_8652 [Amycolatopsis niigatensis]